MAERDFTLASLAPAAVLAGLFPLFSKVGGEGISLAVIQSDQLNHLLQAVDLRLLSIEVSTTYRFVQVDDRSVLQ